MIPNMQQRILLVLVAVSSFVGEVQAFSSTKQRHSSFGWRQQRRSKAKQRLCTNHLVAAEPDSDHANAANSIERCPDETTTPTAFPRTDDGSGGNTHIPGAGFSVSDELEAAAKDRWVTEVVPLQGIAGVAQLVTTAIQSGSFEPVRYLVALSPPPSVQNATTTSSEEEEDVAVWKDYVMVDLPPFSTQLATRMQAFMGSHSRLLMALITTRDSIHYDDAPSVYQTRRPDLDQWKKVFPDLQIVGYRLDIPRDCRHAVTQVLDGYGPFALQEGQSSNATFVETGRPLTYNEWEYDVAQEAMNGNLPPEVNITAAEQELYSPLAIRKREAGKRILALYTPGHSYGSMTYVFPETSVCCSGFAIPIEDNREEDNLGTGTTGPAFDARGYITTSKESGRQMESAKEFVETYADRFQVVLPGRGAPLYLEDAVDDRKETLMDSIRQFEKIGLIYEQLGIFSDED